MTLTLRRSLSALKVTEADRALLVQVIRSQAELPDAEWEDVSSRFCVRMLDKEDFLLRAGDRATVIAVVVRGILREFYGTPTGQEFTRAFCGRGSVSGSLYDLLSAEPAITHIQALETTRLLVLPYATFEAACARHPHWHQVARRSAEALYQRKVRREFEMLSMDATQRLASLRAQLGPLEGRIPLRHVATYLGITPEHLSRIRRRSRASGS